MKAIHGFGAALGGILAVVFVGVARHYGFSSIDQTEAAVLALGCVAAGAAVMHAIWNMGLIPILVRVFTGPPKAAAAVVQQAAQAGQREDGVTVLELLAVLIFVAVVLLLFGKTL